jgi:hypothetical protein
MGVESFLPNIIYTHASFSLYYLEGWQNKVIIESNRKAITIYIANLFNAIYVSNIILITLILQII